MEHPRNTKQAFSSLQAVVWNDGISVEDARKISEDLDVLLTSEDGVRLLKQHPDHFEVVLRLFIRTIFYQNHDVAGSCLKHSNAILELYRGQSPKTRSDSYKEFEQTTFLNLVGSLKPRVEANDQQWVELWTFACNLLTSHSVSISSLNKLLNITEAAYKNKNAKHRVEIIESAWVCWRNLIDAFGRNPRILTAEKAIGLLMKPLLTLSYSSESKIDTWIHLIEVKGLSGPSGIVKSIVKPMLVRMYESGERSMSRHTPDDCAKAIVKILCLSHVEHCLPEVIGIFGACVNSRPSAGIIEQFACILVEAINGVKDDGESYKLWKSLLEQYNSCTESPILSQACQNIFTDVNFLRWLDSSTIEGKDITELMTSAEFREKVLLRSIKSLTFDEQADTPSKKKSRKGSYEDVWSNFCEAYISWWANLSPPSPKESEKAEAFQSLKDSCDYQAVQFLLLQPIQLNIWNPTVCKTWTLLCEACHNHKFLHTFVRSIFDSVCEPSFQVQKAIDVSDFLYKLDNVFCKQSTKVLENLSSAIFSLEFQSLLDVLNLLEIVVNYPEMVSVLTKICKNANEKSSDYDQLNGHKIRTKVSKITRKLEQHSNSAEKDKPAKAQRAPFRAQSNFLHRLAKAEEKNKTKSPFLSSMFSGSVKVENGVDNDGDGMQDHVPSTNGSQENGMSDDDKKPLQENGVNVSEMPLQENGVSDGNKKPMNNVDDSEMLPMITLSSMLKKSPANTNGHTEEAVTNSEKGSPTVNGVPPTVSPRMKITNARELKTVDSNSPSAPKKPKPIAGLKTTPKKLTPSKVSYFDDDANDFVMVPPRPKTTPLTEHQVEMMSKRRTDIPALYQDLSQDTQQSQKGGVILEVTTGVSPKTIQESQDIVPGTPSPEDRAASTPELKKTSTSAKKLDFTNLSTTPPKTSLMNGSVHEMSPSPEQPKSVEKTSEKPLNVFSSTNADIAKDDKSLVNGHSGAETGDIRELVVLKPESQRGTEEKKKKRKSEPTKFSPKLTRSKKNLKSATPDAKLLRTLDATSKASLRAKSPESSVRSGRKSPQPGAKSDRSDSPQPGSKPDRPKSPQPGAKSDRPLSPEPNADMLELLDLPKDSIVRARCSIPINSLSPELTNKTSGDITKPPLVEKGNCDEVPQNSDSQGSPVPLSHVTVEILPSSQSESNVVEPQDKPKKTRKRKMVDTPNNDTPKKVKPLEEEPSSSAKKNDSTKKKKPFKLGTNLENWLVKTERVPTPTIEPEVKTEKVELCSGITLEPEKADSESLSDGTVVDLDNSEEIVPSTQELATENHKSMLPILETKVDERCSTKADEKCSTEIEIKKEYPIVEVEKEGTMVPTDTDSSPQKPEGSVLERLSHESPNDDIDLIISPSKRQRRAPSVFRGEGDTYLAKEMLYSAPLEEPEEESKSSRAKKTISSPTSKKRLQLGGRSAKMLRLATGSSSAQEDNDEIIVTPSRRRESIAPVKYGENWPKGPTEEWVACTPQSPYMSPFRSVLKKTPGLEENTTPQRNRSELASPLLSSAKRKRVVFLDPPVTRGLLYDLDSPGGSIHHADVPPGTPYPTWKDEDNQVRMEVSPSKRDAERLSSLADIKPNSVLDEDAQDVSPSKRKGCTKGDSQPCNLSVLSDEVRQLIDLSEPTNVPSPEPDINALQEKFQLSEDFMTTLSETESHLRSLLVQCFDCANMKKTVGAWKFEDCITINHMPKSFLVSVRNSKGEVITDILNDFYSPPQSSECFAQTEQQVLANSSSQTPSPPLTKESHSQTTITKCRTVEMNTELNTTTSSTQADLRLPTADELPQILDKVTTQECFSFLKNIASFCENKPPK